MTDKETRELLEEYGRELRSEDPDAIRQRFKQARPGSRASASTGACPICGYVLVDGICFWDDHGCRNGCGPVSLKDDAFCQVCGSVTFRCPGEGCKSRVHASEGVKPPREEA